MSAPLTIGSLFSGIGGLELGLERGIGNGARTIWQVEQSEYCRAVLAKHWPDATRYDDVRTVGRSTLAPVDVVCGGFPCQDVSTAGGKTGLAGERSGLWREYARLVRELRPRYVVVENVAALLVRGLGTVLGDLAACGYDAWWDCIPASAVGAPIGREGRDRLWLVAYADEGRREGAWLSREAHREPLGRVARRGRAVAGLSGAAPNHWATEPDVARVADGIPARVDRIGALGNAVVPACAEVVGRLIAEREAQLNLEQSA